TPAAAAARTTNRPAPAGAVVARHGLYRLRGILAGCGALTLGAARQDAAPNERHRTESTLSKAGWSRTWPTSTLWSASSLRPGGCHGGDSRCRHRRHAHTWAHGPSWPTLRPLVGLVRRSAGRSSRSFRMGVAVGGRGDRRRPVVARSRRSRFGQALDRRSLLHDGRAGGPRSPEWAGRMTAPTPKASKKAARRARHFSTSA